MWIRVQIRYVLYISNTHKWILVMHATSFSLYRRIDKQNLQLYHYCMVKILGGHLLCM